MTDSGFELTSYLPSCAVWQTTEKYDVMYKTTTLTKDLPSHDYRQHLQKFGEVYQ